MDLLALLRGHYNPPVKPAPILALALAIGIVLGAGGAVLLQEEVESDVDAEVARFERVLGPLSVPAGNPQDPEKVELGRTLFFDPRLSGGNEMSCATCHNPDKGFSDGLPRAVGAKGELGRNSPTIWNAAYVDFPFWDGRASSLEQQAAGPITADVEMAQRIPELLSELRAVPEYVRRFTRVFGEDAITFTNVLRAIAAFERTVLTYDSAFDRYQAGEESALSPRQRQGMGLFFGKARCGECHTAPLLSDNGFHVLGVPAQGPGGEDVGRFAVTGDEGDRGAFRTPTLRNIELTGPYMHNGALRTLADVVAFYDAGGGDAPNKSRRMRPLNLTDDERAALVAFMRALTDTTSTPVRRPRLP